MTTAIQSIDSTTTAISIGGVEAFRFTANNFTNLNTASLNGGQLAGFRNRIINGDMRIDQRNNGASQTPTGGPTVAFVIDRWQYGYTQTAKFTVGRNLGGGTLPNASFQNYIGFTVASAYTPAASDAFYVRQMIEGLNVADLGWGSATAQTITVSFWVNSSVTGTHSGSVNNGSSRAYPFTYPVNSANTWEKKSITIPGDTAGTWPTDNTASMLLIFDIGCGANYRGTAGTWNNAMVDGASGAVQVVATAGATFRVTGAQLESGTVASAFEYRPYGVELFMCQRYYQTHAVSGNGEFAIAQAYTTTTAYGAVRFSTTMRAPPTMSQIATACRLGGEAVGALGWDSSSTTGFLFHCANTTTAFVTGNAVLLLQANSPTTPIWAASAEL